MLEHANGFQQVVSGMYGSIWNSEKKGPPLKCRKKTKVSGSSKILQSFKVRSNRTKIELRSLAIFGQILRIPSLCPILFSDIESEL